MKQYLILTKKDLKELFRTNRILILTALMLFFAVSAPILTKFTPEILAMIPEFAAVEMPPVTFIDSYTGFISDFSSVIMIGVVIIFAGSIIKERTKGLYANLLNNGVKPHWFVLAKLESQVITLTLAYIVSMIAFIIAGQIAFGEILFSNTWVIFLSIYVYLLFAVAVVNFFGSIAKNFTLTIVYSLLFIFGTHMLNLFEFGKYLPNYLITIAMESVTAETVSNYLLPNIGVTAILFLVITTLTIKLISSKE